MALKADEFARRDGASMHWREEPLRAVWHFDQLVSSDSHTVEGRLECSVRIARHSADRQMLAETFLGQSDSVTVDQIVQRFSLSLQTALSNLIGAHPAVHAVDPGHHAGWIESIRKAGDALAFASGLELLAPLQLHLYSPSLDRQKQRDIAGARQRDDLQRATELLKQFQAMRQAAPEVSAGQLLQRLAAEDRGLALQSLLLAESAQSSSTSVLWAVAGPTLVRIDPRLTPPSIQLHPLPTDLGPLRSVQSATMNGKQMMLIGAQRGVIVVERSNLAEVRGFACPTLDSQLGFNRVICNASGLWGSHGDAGLVHWRVDDPAAPCTAYSEPESRNLESLDNSRLIHSTGNSVVVRDGERRLPLDLASSSPIVGIIPLGRCAAIVRENGQIQLIDSRSLRLIDTLNRGTILRSAAAMPWQGDMRLLLATDQGPVDCTGLEDPLVTQYLSAHRGLKKMAATTDLLAAVSPDRQRVIVWRNWDGQRPMGEIHIASHTRHRIADICFV